MSTPSHHRLAILPTAIFIVAGSSVRLDLTRLLDLNGQPHPMPPFMRTSGRDRPRQGSPGATATTPSRRARTQARARRVPNMLPPRLRWNGGCGSSRSSSMGLTDHSCRVPSITPHLSQESPSTRCALPVPRPNGRGGVEARAGKGGCHPATLIAL